MFNPYGMNSMAGMGQNQSFNPSYNAGLQAQQRLMQLDQQQQMMQQQMMPQQQMMQQQQSGFTIQGKQVADIDEVKAQSIPLDGSTSYFPSACGRFVYTKKLNLDGTCSVQTYKITEAQAPDTGQSSNPISLDENYVTRYEFDLLRTELEGYKKIFLGGFSNEQQYDANVYANDAGGKGKSAKSNTNVRKQPANGSSATND